MSIGADACDVAIVGGGMVGASLALALAGTSLRIVLVEAVVAGGAEQPSFDDRSTALGNGARRMLDTLGVWSQLSACAAPIRSIHVSDAGHFGFARLEAAAQGIDAFGYTISNRHIGAVLWDVLRADLRISVRAPARVLEVQPQAQCVHLLLSDDSGVRSELQARLVVAADGAHSLVKQAAGIASDTTDYGQLALIANIRTERRASGTAYERFTDSGPLALLPLFDGSYTVVWSLSPQRAELMLGCDATAFISELQRRFGWRAGKILQIGKRGAYPLTLTRAAQTVGLRTVLVGNAAQALHPVAAQGFNLGLRDVATLAELVAGAADPGAAALLGEFARRRSADRSGMIGFTDRLVRVFGDQRAGAIALRNLGLLLFDLAPPAKRALSRLSWGFGGALPRLVRGLPLT